MILKVIKRNGEEVSFEISKIKNAITKANKEIAFLILEISKETSSPFLLMTFNIMLYLPSKA